MCEKSDWQKARQIIRDFLDSQDWSPSRLARAAGINRSILSKFLNNKEETLAAISVMKVYNVIHPKMNLLSRREFFKAAGLSIYLEAIPSLLPDRGTSTYLADTDVPQRGNQLMAIGQDIARHSWEKAIPIFREVEGLLGESSIQAAKAGCEVAQILINLGDYDKAYKEVERIHTAYSSIINPEVECELCNR